MSDQINITTGISDAVDHTVSAREVIKSESWNATVNDFKARINALNDAIQDLETSYSKTTAPQNIVEGKLWADISTDPAILKYYKDGSTAESLVGLTNSQTLTNKTLTSPTLTSPTISGTKTDSATGTYSGQNTFTSKLVSDRATNAISFDIQAAGTTENTVNFTSTAATTAYIISIPNADSLTTGRAFNVVSNSSDTSARSLVRIHQDHSSASQSVCLELVNDAATVSSLNSGGLKANGNILNFVGSIVADYTTGAGHGSTNTKIRRIETAKTAGNGITYATSSTAGSTFTIVTTGMYIITYSDSSGSADLSYGISKNSSQLTTAIQSITAADRLCWTTTNVALLIGPTLTWCGLLTAGDIIRPHTSGSQDGTLESIQFRIIRIW